MLKKILSTFILLCLLLGACGTSKDDTAATEPTQETLPANIMQNAAHEAVSELKK